MDVVDPDEPVLPRRLQRLADELEDDQIPALDGAPDQVAALVELAYALRPDKHEGRVPPYGSLLIADVEKLGDAAQQWGVDLIDVSNFDRRFARRFADGVSSFTVHSGDGITHLACFVRNMADERDLIELQDAIGGVIVQRHPRGQVRVFGEAGVVRWDRTHWLHEPPTDAWLDRLRDLGSDLPVEAIGPLLQFAMHNLAGRGIGTILIWRPDKAAIDESRYERLVHNTPRLTVAQIGQQAAIAQAIALTDGAAMFDAGGNLTDLGIRLVPSRSAESAISTIGGTRHTSALRYSFDDPQAILIVVSEAGPVTIMHDGQAITTIDRADEKIG